MLAFTHPKTRGSTVIDFSAYRERVVAQLPGDITIVVSETPTSQLFDMSFEEQQDVIFETLQSFEEIE